MLRGSECCLVVRFHSPLHFLSFFSSVSKLIRFFPEILDASYISEKKKEKSLPTPDSPRFPSNSTPLLASQLYSSLPAFLCPRWVTTASNSADLPSLCVITHRLVWSSSAGRTDGGMSMKVGQQSAFGSNLFQDLCSAPLPPLCQITQGSHLTPSVGPWGLFSAISRSQCKPQISPPPPPPL